MNDAEKAIRLKLLELRDLKYKNFHCRLMPTIASDRVIGVRVPELRRLAKELSKTPEALEFIKSLPHYYYEENNLHGLLIEAIGDYDRCIGEIDAFLPYVDNWATCDLISPKVFKKHKPELLEKIKEWLKSPLEFTVRFGMETLMSFYLDEDFKPEYLELAASVRSDKYYINMMTAWFFATALAKQYDFALPYIEEQRLEKWTHNKTIQKAVESYRITDEQKRCLRDLKVTGS